MILVASSLSGYARVYRYLYHPYACYTHLNLLKRSARRSVLARLATAGIRFEIDLKSGLALLYRGLPRLTPGRSSSVSVYTIF